MKSLKELAQIDGFVCEHGDSIFDLDGEGYGMTHGKVQERFNATLPHKTLEARMYPA